MKKILSPSNQKVWLLAVDMGYGHQRTAYPLRFLAFEGKIINANNYEGIPEVDRRTWGTSQRFYEFISNFYRAPLIGKISFKIFDQFQKILSFYPKRDLSKPNLVLKQIYSLFRNGWGRDLIEKLKINPEPEPSVQYGARNEKPAPYHPERKREIGVGLKRNLPIISTFFIPAFMAEFFNYPGEIFCVVCDADIARTWAPLNPQKSKIKYFAPNERVVERLKLYGIKPENIFLTGFPLPQEIIGRHPPTARGARAEREGGGRVGVPRLTRAPENLETLKGDLRHRMVNLDPQKRYFEKYKLLIEENLGKLPGESGYPLTIMFSVGGAGAQKEIGAKIIKNLNDKIKTGQIKIILSAGIREKVKKYFEEKIKNLELGKNIEILYSNSIGDYFEKFNQALRKTDILWTKPSELSFYSALGLPIIIAPPIGSQEEFNMRWLLKSGFGTLQENPSYTKEWLFDWLEKGYLAEMAMEGFIEGEKLGSFKISKIISAQ